MDAFPDLGDVLFGVLGGDVLPVAWLGAALCAVEVGEAVSASSGGFGVAQQACGTAGVEALFAVQSSFEVVIKSASALAGCLSPGDDCLGIVELLPGDEWWVLSGSFGAGVGDDAEVVAAGE